jgi:hypothetical protein
MADCGVGEFLWIALEEEDGRAGANLLSLMDKPDDCDLMSDGLFAKFEDWAKEYMAGQPKDWSLSWNIDWQSFNRRGLELTAMLQEELGNNADVQYLPPESQPSAT